MKSLTLDYCYEMHKKTFDDWRYGEPVEYKHNGDILIIKYQSGAWFHYKVESNRLIWW